MFYFSDLLVKQILKDTNKECTACQQPVNLNHNIEHTCDIEIRIACIKDLRLFKEEIFTSALQTLFLDDLISYSYFVEVSDCIRFIILQDKILATRLHIYRTQHCTEFCQENCDCKDEDFLQEVATELFYEGQLSADYLYCIHDIDVRESDIVWIDSDFIV